MEAIAYLELLGSSTIRDRYQILAIGNAEEDMDLNVVM
jgi:hypothetical protein